MKEKAYMVSLLESGSDTQHFKGFDTFDEAVTYIAAVKSDRWLPYGIWEWAEKMKLIAVCFYGEVFVKRNDQGKT